MNFSEEFAITTAPAANSAAERHGSVRITVLTDRLIRVETGAFTDEPTQTVLCRNLDTPVFRIRDDGDSLLISTPKAALCIGASDGKMRYAKTRDCGKVTSLSGNLKGTRRTLDATSGSVPLKDGILSKNGAAMLDDSKSLLLSADGSITPRPACCDRYYFLYGRDYRAALRDFYRLCGFTPLLPRFALGNWWSRYYAYTQDEYLSLMRRFQKEKIPFTVATVDMDWHWVKVQEKFGKEASLRHVKRAEGEVQRFHTTGWTGYSWNTDLFPDHRAFLKELHKEHLRVTLNLHPAAGVQFFEDAYPEMAKAMGIDPKSKEHISFDITDPAFLQAYFDILHHPYEREGVDFWWIDWQQGTRSKVAGLDPLWGLNHYHYLDSRRDGKRGLILSRYAGPGSHRYPLGFSGDAGMTFSSLRFQPYFTATASNIGYTWWSHDIGGHNLGIHDDELYIRWLQFGVFSPINRLHATSDPFMGKEPWNYQYETQKIAQQWLQLRKRLIPCLYTANYRTHTEGSALIEPMYYGNPWDQDAYRVRNQYRFAGSLLVAPITGRSDSQSGLGETEVYLDGKRYTDLFTGDIYNYRGIHSMHRGRESIPVLAQEGTILPLDMDATANGAEIPKALELLIFSGNGKYTLYEDDGETMCYQNGAFATRDFSVKETGQELIFAIEPAKGNLSLLPEKRMFRLSFRNVCASAKVLIEGAHHPKIRSEEAFLSIDLPAVTNQAKITVSIRQPKVYIPYTRKEKKIRLLSSLTGSNVLKTVRYLPALKNERLYPLLPAAVRSALREIDRQWEKQE